MPELVDLSGPKPSINSRNAIVHTCQGIDINQPFDFGTILENIESEVRNQCHTLTQGAISNCRGSWYEWLLSARLYNKWVLGETNVLGLPLPNIARFDCAKLYVPEITSYVFDLRKKLKDSLQIELITSNPDFVFVDTSDIDIDDIGLIETLSHETIDFLDNLYLKIVGKCRFENIVGYMATKTSLRPDRRLQIVHEGSLTKAVYVHIQTRLWIQIPKGIKYFGVSLALNDKDRRALRTVATHSITTVGSIPDRAVDECYQIRTTEELDKAFLNMSNMMSTHQE